MVGIGTKFLIFSPQVTRKLQMERWFQRTAKEEASLWILWSRNRVKRTCGFLRSGAQATELCSCSFGPGRYAMLSGRRINKVSSRHLFHKKRTCCLDFWRIAWMLSWLGMPNNAWGLVALPDRRPESGEWQLVSKGFWMVGPFLLLCHCPLGTFISSRSRR